MMRAVIPEGTEAPGFELPAWVDGEQRRLALDGYVGEDVVILAFYPADFNPACDADSDLDELDLFTMQKDVAVLAVGPDTLYSHAAFADEYDLHIPLLSDTRHEVAETYDVAFEDDVGQRLVERAVVVVDHDGVVQYAWSSPEMETLPPVDEIKDAIADTGSDDTAFARYRVGYAHYTEGRRAFTSAMHSYGDSDWMIAQSDFKRAREEFEAAADHFDSAVRFVDDAELEGFYDTAQEKATALWQAADWLSQSASEYSSGQGAEAQELRDDAERPLENARQLSDPVDPDDWPPEPDGGDGDESFLPADGDRTSALGVDIDAEASDESGDADASDDGAEGEAADAGGATDGEDTIDDEELEEISAELAASKPENPEGEELEESPTSMVDAPPERTGDDRSADSDTQSDGTGSDAAPTDDAEIDGDVGEADLEALEAEMAASQSVADEERPDRSEGEASEEDGAADDETTADPPDDDSVAEGSVDGPDDVGTDEQRPGDGDEGPGDPAADPHADLAGGSGGVPPEVSGSLEPVGDDEGAVDGDDGPVETDLDDPEGASDDDLANIPTAEELADDEDDA